MLARNVIFNQLLESGDHGPINTWSRTAYLQTGRGKGAGPTTIQEWTRIDNNFVMVGPKMGSLYGPGLGPCSNGVATARCPKGGGSMFTCLDHDDGSDYYLDTRNVCVFAGTEKKRKKRIKEETNGPSTCFRWLRHTYASTPWTRGPVRAAMQTNPTWPPPTHH